MDANVLTISLNSWMELPGLTWFEWESKCRGISNPNARRVTVADVAAYYSDYIRLNKLSRYFRSGVIVTAIHQIDRMVIIFFLSFLSLAYRSLSPFN